MEWLTADRASTIPSVKVTVRPASNPSVRPPDRSVRGCPVDVYALADTGVESWDHVGLAIVHESNVGDEAFVEDLVDFVLVIQRDAGSA